MENTEIKDYLPGDPELIEKIVFQLKRQGLFDEFRKECLADVDTKPAYQNLRQRVDSSVAAFLNSTTWCASLNKKNVRENLRKHVYDCKFLDMGVERIVEQVVNPKICSVFVPKVEQVVYQFLGIKVDPNAEAETLANSNKWASGADIVKPSLVKEEPTDLMPEELEPISPDHDEFSDNDESRKTKENKKTNSTEEEEIEIKKEVLSPCKTEVVVKQEDEISPDFEVHLGKKDSESGDSDLSGISDMTSHGSPKQSNSREVHESPKIATADIAQSPDLKIEMDLQMKTEMDLVGAYIKEGASSLELGKLTTGELKQLIQYLPGSQLKKLSFTAETSAQEWEPLFEALKASKVQKLGLYYCYTTQKEYLHLMELVKETKITNFTIFQNIDVPSDQRELAPFDLDEFNQFISCIVDSHLEIFHFNFHLFNELNLASMFNTLPQTRMTRFLVISMGEQCLTPVTFNSLFRNLEFTQLTNVSVSGIGLDNDSVKLLSPALKNSNVKSLSLRSNYIDDDGVDILVEGLLHSKINYLDLGNNLIEGANVLGFHLKDTHIETLDLSSNDLKQYGFFLMPLKVSSLVELILRRCSLTIAHFKKIMKSLKFSKVTELDVSENELKLNAEVSNIFKDTNLKRVNFSNNHFDQEALICLAGSIRYSKLSHIDISKCFQRCEEKIGFSLFLSEVGTSTISSLDLSENRLVKADIDTIALHLENSKVTHLTLSSNSTGNGVRSLAKLTQLSHLYLQSCYIYDEGVEDLALILKNTQLIELDVSFNEFTSVGVRNLAPHLKDSHLLQLKLHQLRNKIKSDGLDALVQGAENTFITYLSVQLTESQLALDLVLWRNKIAKQRLLNLFKLISPKLGSNSFRFEHPDVLRTSEFLESCLELCVTITQKPSAISVLLEDESIRLSKEKIISLILDEFPSQFVLFVARSVEADVEAHVSLLKTAEDLKLRKVVEMFLLNRPLFTIDKNKGILHPYAYKLLHKYNYPICNLEVEPEGVQKISKYFIEHGEIEGASDIIKLLC